MFALKPAELGPAGLLWRRDPHGKGLSNHYHLRKHVELKQLVALSHALCVQDENDDAGMLGRFMFQVGEGAAMSPLIE